MLIRLRGFAASMGGRIFAVMMAGILTASVVASFVAGLERRSAAAAARADRIGDRIVEAIAARAPVPGVRRLPAGAALRGGRADPDVTARIRARGGALAGAVAYDLPRADCHPERPGPAAFGRSPPRPGPGCYAVRPGTALPVLLIDAPPVPGIVDGLFGWGFFGALFLGAAILSALIARMAARPITRLGIAAARLSDDLDAAPMQPTGPADVRAAITAFNRMQATLRRNIAERSHILAAVSHDLRTPLTRMRLRIETLDDAAVRARLAVDIGIMRALIEQGIDLARAADQDEVPQRVDLAALVDSIVEDACDAGHPVRLIASPPIVLVTSVAAVRRIVTNLIDNAILYAGETEVALETTGATVRIAVRDRGPGIPDHLIEAMYAPFRRLDEARHTQGTGLGLTISRMLAHRINATLDLANRHGGGLSAVVTFHRETLRPD